MKARYKLVGGPAAGSIEEIDSDFKGDYITTRVEDSNPVDEFIPISSEVVFNRKLREERYLKTVWIFKNPDSEHHIFVHESISKLVREVELLKKEVQRLLMEKVEKK